MKDNLGSVFFEVLHIHNSANMHKTQMCLDF